MTCHRHGDYTENLSNLRDRHPEMFGIRYQLKLVHEKNKGLGTVKSHADKLNRAKRAFLAKKAGEYQQHPVRKIPGWMQMIRAALGLA